jgi:hypothetical protein
LFLRRLERRHCEFGLCGGTYESAAPTSSLALIVRLLACRDISGKPGSRQRSFFGCALSPRADRVEA